MFRIFSVIAALAIIAHASPVAEPTCDLFCTEQIRTCAPGTSPPPPGACECPCVPGIYERATPPPSCATPTKTVHTSLPSPPFHCDLVCIEEGATTCSPGQLPTPPPGVATTTSGCTVSIITSAAPACGPCQTCIL